MVKCTLTTKTETKKEIKMNTSNLKIMNRKSIASAIALAFVLIGGCGWVQDRVPDDYYDRWNSTDANGSTGSSGTTEVTQTENEGGGTSQDNAGGASNTSSSQPTDGQNGADAGGQPQQNQGGVTFEIPQGWYWRDPAHMSAAKGDPAASPDYQAAEGKIEVFGISDGTAEEARTTVLAAHANNMRTCQNEGDKCTGTPLYREVEIGGINVYAAVSQPEFAENRTTYARFAKNGKVVTVIVYDDIDHQMLLLEKVVSTINWQE
jgi:hypothetical protein